MNKVLAIVLGGGKGTRLFPLTMDRAKPAVPFGGRYRIVDIPISNCINAGFKQIYILTQFNSASLHLHIAKTYIFDIFSDGFAEVLAAEQTLTHSGWYEGTADAVRKNLVHFRTQNPTHYLIVSGDQLYRMDLDDMFKQHVESGCELSISCTTVNREDASDFGIMKVDASSRIVEFQEKPGKVKDISDFKVPKDLLKERRGSKEYLASMGIYIFNASLMEKCLDNDLNDFGKEVIPTVLSTNPINAYIFDGYWEDIGTIRSFYEANLNLTSIAPEFEFYDEIRPIYTHRRNLPASKINYSTLNQALTSDGCIITNASISNSIVGIRTIIETGASFDGVVCMGADYYETDEQKAENVKKHIPNIGIGQGSIIKRAIIDKNARVGANCRIGVDARERIDGEFGSYYIVDGIIVVPKNGIIEEGTII
ncbi:glucose-1-phosphate adenylyltransferase [Spirochaetota bacterium]